MTRTSNITETTVTGEEIYTIIAELEPVLESLPRTHSIIALLSLVITMMDPDVTEEDIYAGVKGASQWICLFLEGRGEPTGLMN